MTIGIAVKLNQDFSVIRETLERIGIKNKKKMTFYPSFYCVESSVEGIYKIVHFKELFPLFGRETTFDESDKIRLKTGVHLLKNWGLVDIVNPEEIDEILQQKLTVLRHEEKHLYNVIHKFKFSTRVVVD